MEEIDWLPLSALSQFLWCPRRCALIHIEQAWEENLFTAKGRMMHDKAHDGTSESRDGVRIERGMRLCSKRLGLNGMADIVEFHKQSDGKIVPFPVEYKHGKPKENDCDRVQLCAQALCLEETLNVVIPVGALFYGKTRHREDVEFTPQLRKITEDTVYALHEFIKAGKTPSPVYAKRCESCSLIDICMPKTFGASSLVHDYLQNGIMNNSEEAIDGKD